MGETASERRDSRRCFSPGCNAEATIGVITECREVWLCERHYHERMQVMHKALKEGRLP